MSYKLDLSALAGLDRSEHGAVTRALVDFFVEAIDAGRLTPGAQLPPPRELAAAAAVNRLTAARVYRRLAELGYVTARVGRGTFVSARAAAAAETGDGEWQSYVLPERRMSYAAQILQDQFRTADQEGIISLAVGWPTARPYPVRELRAIADEVFADAALERVLARHEVKLCALQPACHSPTGRDLAPARRERLIELAQQRSFFILEDGVYATLRYEGTEPPRLRSGAPAHVIYVDSLSKTVGGGLRIGWVASRGPVRARLAALKMATDVHTSALDQHIAARYLAAGHHDRQLERALPYYRERRDALTAALERHLAGEYRATRPAGGPHPGGPPRPPGAHPGLSNPARPHPGAGTPRA